MGNSKECVTILSQNNSQNNSFNDLGVEELGLSDSIKSLIDIYNQDKNNGSKEKGIIINKEFVRKLENHKPEEIRYFLIKTDLLSKDYRLLLSKMVGLSFSGTGGEDYSSILEVLTPEEINEVVANSYFYKHKQEDKNAVIYSQGCCDIFSGAKSDIIKPGDYDNFSSWIELNIQEYTEIIKEGNKRKIALLRKDRKTKKWFIFKESINISKDSIYSFFSSILNSNNTDAWKEESLYSLDLNLLAYAAIEYPEIIDICRHTFPKIAEAIEETLKNGYCKIDSGDIITSTVERSERAIKIMQDSGKKYSEKEYNKMVMALLDVGIQGPYNEEMLQLGGQIIEDQKLLEATFHDGLKEPEEYLKGTSSILVEGLIEE